MRGAGDDAAEREVEDDTRFGLAGAAERGDLQVGHRGEQARQQAHQAVPELVALDRRAQDQATPTKPTSTVATRRASMREAPSSTAPPIRNSAIHTDDM